MTMNTPLTIDLNREIEAIVASHTDWKHDLVSYVLYQDQHIDVNFIGDALRSTLGRWLAELPVSLRSSSHYREILRLNFSFHVQAERIASMISQRQFDAAQQKMLGLTFRIASDQLTAALTRWQNDTPADQNELAYCVAA